MTCAELRTNRDLKCMTKAEIGHALSHLANCASCHQWVRANVPDPVAEEREACFELMEELLDDAEALTPRARKLVAARLGGKQ